MEGVGHRRCRGCCDGLSGGNPPHHIIGEIGHQIIGVGSTEHHACVVVVGGTGGEGRAARTAGDRTRVSVVRGVGIVPCFLLTAVELSGTKISERIVCEILGNAASRRDGVGVGRDGSEVCTRDKTASVPPVIVLRSARDAIRSRKGSGLDVRRVLTIFGSRGAVLNLDGLNVRIQVAAQRGVGDESFLECRGLRSATAEIVVVRFGS